MIRLYLAVLLLIQASSAAAESFQIVSVFPPTFATHRRIMTTGETRLAQSGGFVGIGTAMPRTTLEIGGLLRIGDYSIAQESTVKELVTAPVGAIHYDSGGPAPSFRVKAASGWTTLVAPGSASQCCSDMQVFDAVGVHYFIAPGNVSQVTVEAWGGGGGSTVVMVPPPGLGVLSASGGGAGGYAKAIVPVVPGAAYAITVGDGGLGGHGGDSSFGSLVLARGGRRAGNALPLGGAAICGTGVISCVTIVGEPGEHAPPTLGYTGGSSPNGGGGSQADGTVPGGGAGIGYLTISISEHRGAHGRVVVSW